jgi:hypothetical protein
MKNIPTFDSFINENKKYDGKSDLKPGTILKVGQYGQFKMQVISDLGDEIEIKNITKNYNDAPFKREKSVYKNAIIMNESALNEGSYADLEKFLNEIVSLVQKNKKDYSLETNRSIMLDVVGGFGFKNETVVINVALLAKDMGTPEDFAKNLVNGTFKKYNSVLRKGYTRSGDYYFTYKK